MQIEEIYAALKNRKLCRSAHDFSRNYLGKHHSYFSVIKVRGEQPSIEAWATLSYALQSRAQVLSRSDRDFVQAAAAQLSVLQHVAAENVMRACAEKLS